MAAEFIALVSSPVVPPFIYLHHPHHPPSTIVPSSFPDSCLVVRLDAIEHSSARLFFSGIIHRLGSATDTGEIATWDDFARHLRRTWETQGSGSSTGQSKGKGKGKAVNGSSNGTVVPEKILIVVTKAERMRSVLGGGWSVITRMAEMTGVPASVVLASQVPWDEVRPPRGDAREPVHVYFEPLARQEILKQMLPGSSHPLYPRFLELLLTTVQPLLPHSPPLELEYLAQALWPVYTSYLPPHAEQVLLHRPFPDPANPPAPLAISVKLLTDLKHQSSLAFTSAIEEVLPRQIGPRAFTDALLPRTTESGAMRPAKGLSRVQETDLPLCARYLLIAAYCASYNPAKSDMRLFGRGVGADGKRRRGGARRAGYGRTRIGKVPQRLLGPKPFPLDRLLAIFAALFEEHAERPEDLQARLGDESGSSAEDGYADDWVPSISELTERAKRKRKREVARNERWEDEVEHLTMSVGLWRLIPDLERRGLLRRMSPLDRLDNVMLRCEVDHEAVTTIARGLRITLDEYMYEAAT